MHNFCSRFAYAIYAKHAWRKQLAGRQASPKPQKHQVHQAHSQSCCCWEIISVCPGYKTNPSHPTYTSHHRRHYIVLIYPPTSNSRTRLARNTGKRKRTNFPNSPHAMQRNGSWLLLEVPYGEMHSNSRGGRPSRSVGRRRGRVVSTRKVLHLFATFPARNNSGSVVCVCSHLGSGDKHLHASVLLTMS